MVIEEVDLCVSRWCIVSYFDQMYDCGSDDYTTHGSRGMQNSQEG